MLSRQAPFILVSVVLVIVYIIYTSDDGSDVATDGLHAAAQHSSARPELTTRVRSDAVYVGRNNRSSKLKTILYWNDIYGSHDLYNFGLGHQAFRFVSLLEL